MIVEESKLLDKFVVAHFVFNLPLVKGGKICLLEIPIVIPMLVEPVSYVLVRD
jgi:hypothetical protein